MEQISENCIESGVEMVKEESKSEYGSEPETDIEPNSKTEPNKCGQSLWMSPFVKDEPSSLDVKKEVVSDEEEADTSEKLSGPQENSVMGEEVITPDTPSAEALVEVTEGKATKKQVRSFTCSACPKIFTTASKLAIHTRTHSGERPYACEACGRTFARRDRLLDHRRTHAPAHAKSFACDQCGRAFSIAAGLRKHMEQHANGRLRPCEVCGVAYTRANSLAVHRRSHRERPDLTCPHCGRIFPQVSKLQAHVRSHTGERPFVCEECGRAFAYESSLVVHRHTHTGERPHICTLCGAAFTRKCNLQEHQRTLHPAADADPAAVRPHPCPRDGCHKRFARKDKLMLHLRSHERKDTLAAARLSDLALGSIPRGSPERCLEQRMEEVHEGTDL